MDHRKVIGHARGDSFLVLRVGARKTLLFRDSGDPRWFRVLCSRKRVCMKARRRKSREEARREDGVRSSHLRLYLEPLSLVFRAEADRVVQEGYCEGFIEMSSLDPPLRMSDGIVDMRRVRVRS